MNDEEWPEWLCSYRFGDKAFSFTIPARTEAEARQRLRAIGMTGQIDGELVATIPVNTFTAAPVGLFLFVTAGIRNLLFGRRSGAKRH